MSFVIHLLQWFLSCPWTYTTLGFFHPFGCYHWCLFLDTYIPFNFSSIVFQWFWPFASASHPLVLHSRNDSGHPHTILLAVIMTLGLHIPYRWFHAIDRAPHSCLSYIIVALLSLLALAATLSLFILSNGGLRGARVGAEELSLVHGAKPAHHRRPPIIIILLLVIFALFSFF